MRLNVFPAVAVASVVAASPSLASMTNFRDWVDVNGFATNSTSNLWYGQSGVGGPMMAANGSSWTSPWAQHSTPLIGPITSPGSDNGAAGPATFDGLWVHPGSGVPAVLMFAPQAATVVGIVNVHSELIANGLSGNGVTISVTTSIGGVETSRGTTILAGTADERFDEFSLGHTQTLQAGDWIRIAFGDNGSFLFDHVNFNAWMTIPAPASLGVLLAPALLGARRRR